MKNIVILLSACCLILLLCQQDANAQFSRPVVVFKGKVRNAKTLEPHYARISVREAGSQALEVTSSRANASTGQYLVVLKPQTEYLLYIEGPDIHAKTIRIKTPQITKETATVEEDIPVSVMSLKNHTARQ